MSWVLLIQILILICAVGAVVDQWISTARRKLPPKGTRFVNVGEKPVKEESL